MKLVSWNVNGIRASMDKGFRDLITTETPDIICLQETKAHPDQVNLLWAEEFGYYKSWNCARKKGYSGTSIWSKIKPKNVEMGFGMEEHNEEGRVITATYDDFHLVNVYTVNSQRGLKRLDYRLEWDEAFLDHVTKLNRSKPVIFCGDLNCAHTEIDLANPKSNKKNAGFTPEERAGLDAMAAAGFVDSFRHFDDGPENYSWWTYRMKARERNIGWRLDYFWVAEKLIDQVSSAPVEITLG